MSEVERLSPEEIITLTNSDAAFEQFFYDLPVVKNRRALNDDIQKGNEEMAAANMTMKAEIERLKHEIADLTQIMQSQRGELNQKLAKKAEIMQRNSPAALVQKLNEAVQSTEASSDETADKFHKGEIDIKTFINNYTEQRTSYYARKLKKEQLESSLKCSASFTT
jgi:predicted RNase H-like nuclease (RuvC/YqgF family)